MHLERAVPLYIGSFDQVTTNAVICDKFYRYLDDPDVRKTHFFEGRYENIYIGPERIPELEPVLNQARQYALNILEGRHGTLRVGCWFNLMLPGQGTLPHAHDGGDEVLSGVYYLRVPENSGRLIVRQPRIEQTVTPRAGMFVFFPPDAQHEVTVNESDQDRLSLGINIGWIR